jgi:hypothetical protein
LYRNPSIHGKVIFRRETFKGRISEKHERTPPRRER